MSGKTRHAVVVLVAGALFPSSLTAQSNGDVPGAEIATASAGEADAATDAPRADLQKAADYVFEKAKEGLRVAVAGDYFTFETASGEVLTATSIAEATGTNVTDADMRAVLDLVAAAAGQDGACTTAETASGSACTTGNLCSDLGACSFYGDLASAQGEKLEKYLSEKAQDGRTYEDLDLPLFEARAVTGKTVSSASLKGKPTLLALLAPHCGHSLRSLSTLKRLDRRYGPKGVNVVGVFVNTTTIASAKSRVEQYEIEYPLWTCADDALGDVFESHLAPTMLLIAADGKVSEKLVGEKTERDLAKRIDALLSEDGVELGMAR